jgi:hypothetical protein
VVSDEAFSPGNMPRWCLMWFKLDHRDHDVEPKNRCSRNIPGIPKLASTARRAVTRSHKLEVARSTADQAVSSEKLLVFG